MNKFRRVCEKKRRIEKGWVLEQEREKESTAWHGTACLVLVMSWHTNLAFTDVTTVPTVTFSLMWMGPYTFWSHRGGLLFLSTTSNSTSTSAYKTGVPLSDARTLRRYLSRYWQNMGRQLTGQFFQTIVWFFCFCFFFVSFFHIFHSFPYQ